MAIGLVSGSITGTGATDSVILSGHFNLSLSGFGSATIAVQRSFDSGSTWVDVEEFTADAQKKGHEAESDIHYRLNCSAYTSGTIVYRLSR